MLCLNEFLSPNRVENAKSPSDENYKPRKCQEGCKQKPKELPKQSAILHRLCILPIQLRMFQRITPTEAEVFQNGRQVPVWQGIQWISNYPSLQNAALVQFDGHDCQQNIKKTEKIMPDIRTKFAPNYQNIFDPTVMELWNVWK